MRSVQSVRIGSVYSVTANVNQRSRIDVDG